MVANGFIGAKPPIISKRSGSNAIQNQDDNDNDVSPSSCSFEGTKGVIACPVLVDGTAFVQDNTTTTTNNNNNDNDKGNDYRYDEFVQVYNFEQKEEGKEEDTIMNVSTLLESVRPGIESSDTETLSALHDAFLPIVEHIVHKDGGLYARELNRLNVLKPFVCKYAAPSRRDSSMMYANYLHNDAWFEEHKNDDDHNNNDNNNNYCNDDDSPIAMVNIWFAINGDPPQNQLVFYETSATTVTQTHMLHGNHDEICGKTVVYDQQMSWGRYYCFISGQRRGSERVLLHGAMDILSTKHGGGGGGDKGVEKSDGVSIPERRRSCEMRYTLHAKLPPNKHNRSKVNPSQTVEEEEEEEEDAYGKGLFEETEDD